MKFAVVMPTWKRHGLTEIAMKRWRAIRDASPRHEVTLLAVGSEGRPSLELAARNNFAYAECMNEPLGQKFNYGIQVAGYVFDPDAILRAESDDLFPDHILDVYAKAMESHPLVGFLDGYMLRGRDFTLHYWPGYEDRRPETMGTGRCIRRDLLEAHDYTLFDDDAHNCDHSMTCRVGYGHGLRMADAGVVVVDVKSDLNYTSFEQTMMPNPVPLSILDAFPAAEIASLRTHLATLTYPPAS